MKEHTPVPWVIDAPAATAPARIMAGPFTRKSGHGTTHIGSCCVNHHEDAARIVACVNALSGIEDPAAFMAAAWLLTVNASGLSTLIGSDDPAAEVALIGEQGMDLYRMMSRKERDDEA